MSQFAEATAAFRSNKNINYTVSKLSDLESRLHEWKIKMNTDNSTAEIFTKRMKILRKRQKIFQKRILPLAGGKYVFVHTPR
jgi:hypothetical protein